MADRIIVMNAGKMLQFATPLEIFERPADEFRGDLRGRTADERDGCHAPSGRRGTGCRYRTVRRSARCGLDASQRPRQQEGKKVAAGIRPEHVRLRGGA